MKHGGCALGFKIITCTLRLKRHPERAAFRARKEPRHGAYNRLYKKGQKRFLAWDYYGRGMPLPHNDVVKQKRLAKSKLKRAFSVLNVIQRSGQSPRVGDVCDVESPTREKD